MKEIIQEMSKNNISSACPWSDVNTTDHLLKHYIDETFQEINKQNNTPAAFGYCMASQIPAKNCVIEHTFLVNLLEKLESKNIKEANRIYEQWNQYIKSPTEVCENHELIKKVMDLSHKDNEITNKVVGDLLELVTTESTDYHFPFYRVSELMKLVGGNSLSPKTLGKLLPNWCLSQMNKKYKNELDKKRKNACYNF